MSSKRSGTKWKNVIPFSENMLILNDLCKQYGSRSDPTKRVASSSIHTVCYPASLFAENSLFCMGMLELRGYRAFAYFYKLSNNFWRAVYALLLLFPLICMYNIYFQERIRFNKAMFAFFFFFCVRLDGVLFMALDISWIGERLQVWAPLGSNLLVAYGAHQGPIPSLSSYTDNDEPVSFLILYSRAPTRKIIWSTTILKSLV